MRSHQSRRGPSNGQNTAPRGRRSSSLFQMSDLIPDLPIVTGSLSTPPVPPVPPTFSLPEDLMIAPISPIPPTPQPSRDQPKIENQTFSKNDLVYICFVRQKGPKIFDAKVISDSTLPLFQNLERNFDKDCLDVFRETSNYDKYSTEIQAVSLWGVDGQQTWFRAKNVSNRRHVLIDEARVFTSRSFVGVVKCPDLYLRLPNICYHMNLNTRLKLNADQLDQRVFVGKVLGVHGNRTRIVFRLHSVPDLYKAMIEPWNFDVARVF